MHNELRSFFESVESGDLERAQRHLDELPELVNARDDSGATALHHAAFHGHRALVTLLIARGADVNARDTEHDATPSGWAIHYLRELGGLLAIEIEDTLYAIRNRDVAWTQRLVARHPALVDATDANGKPLASYASELGVAAIASLFASQRPDNGN